MSVRNGDLSNNARAAELPSVCIAISVDPPQADALPAGGLTIQDVARSEAREGSFVLRQALGQAAGSALPVFGGSGQWQRVETRLEHQTDLSA